VVKHHAVTKHRATNNSAAASRVPVIRQVANAAAVSAAAEAGAAAVAAGATEAKIPPMAQTQAPIKRRIRDQIPVLSKDQGQGRLARPVRGRAMTTHRHSPKRRASERLGR
jgi:hypothetical protein